MRVFAQQTTRTRALMVLAPLVLMIVLLVAASGPGSFVGTASAFTSTATVPPPGPFPPTPKPEGPDNIDGNADDYYDAYIDVNDLDALLANDANRGTTHIIDVRSSFEYLADVCPMQIALGMPTYNVTNVGHPVWDWPGPDGIPGNGDDVYEEAYADGYWIGFYFAGTMGTPDNIRMVENPNFHDYFAALMADGEIAPGDHIIVMCQTGYRAGFAAAEIKKMSNMYGWGMTVDNLFGGMLAWSDDWKTDDGLYCDGLMSDPDGDGCDPDNTPGPAARTKSMTLTAPWAYDTARLALVAAPTIWNGSEPHVAVKPQWFSGMGADDSSLSASVQSVYWFDMADYTAGLLSVDVKVTNNAPVDVTPAVFGGLPVPYNMNYAGFCAGYGAAGSGCEPVGQAMHGNAYNTMIVGATATNGVTVSGATLPAWIGTLAANANGIGTVKYNVGAATAFNTQLYAMSTDLPDPTASYPSGYNDPFHTPLMAPIFGTTAAPWPATGMGWYGIYQYPGPVPGP